MTDTTEYRRKLLSKYDTKTPKETQQLIGKMLSFNYQSSSRELASRGSFNSNSGMSPAVSK
jgi:hypothetical protein